MSLLGLAILGAACRKGGEVASDAAPPLATPVPTRVVLFFPGDDGLLHPEPREIFDLPTSLGPRVRLLVEELVLGSHDGFAAPFPWPALVLGVFVDDSGNAYVDLSPPPPDAVAGSAGEVAVLYSTVSTVVANCPGVARAQLLFDGQEVRTLGHLDLSRPVSPRPELIAR
jgi:hypothetical protein